MKKIPMGEGIPKLYDLNEKKINYKNNEERSPYKKTIPITIV